MTQEEIDQILNEDITVAGRNVGSLRRFTKSYEINETLLKIGKQHELVNIILNSSVRLENDLLVIVRSKKCSRWNNLQIDQASILGSGEFGVVFKGVYQQKQVAIKTLKSGTDKDYVKALLMELKVLIHLKEHPHLVNLVGANTKNLRKGTYPDIILL